LLGGIRDALSCDWDGGRFGGDLRLFEYGDGRRRSRRTRVDLDVRNTGDDWDCDRIDERDRDDHCHGIHEHRDDDAIR
jgi:hypothetical protein